MGIKNYIKRKKEDIRIERQERAEAKETEKKSFHDQRLITAAEIGKKKAAYDGERKLKRYKEKRERGPMGGLFSNMSSSAPRSRSPRATTKSYSNPSYFGNSDMFGNILGGSAKRKPAKRKTTRKRRKRRSKR